MSVHLIKAEELVEQMEGRHSFYSITPLIVKCLWHIIMHLKTTGRTL